MEAKFKDYPLKIFRLYTGRDFFFREFLLSGSRKLEELFWLDIALEGHRFLRLEKSLPYKIRLRFRNLYNKAYLWLKVWGHDAEIFGKRKLGLRNLYLSKEAEITPYLYYQRLFKRNWLKANEKSLVKRWDEILLLLAQKKI